MTTDSCCSITGEMDVSSMKNKNRNISQDSSHSSHHTERASNIQSIELYDGLCTVSEGCQSSPENLNVKICSGVGHYVNVPEGSVQVDKCVLNYDVSEQYDQQLNMANKPDVIEDRNSHSCLQNLCEIVSNSDHCIGSLIRSNSFTEISSPDQLHVLGAATRKLAGSPKPVLRWHSMTLSRTKKQVTIETNAKVIEIDTGTSEYPEIESGGTAASTVGPGADYMTSESEFSRMYIGTVSEPENCQSEQPLFNVCQNVSRSSLSVGNVPLSGDKLFLIHDSAAVLQEVPVSSPHKDINVSDIETSPPHAVGLTTARRSYEFKCVEKSCVRHLVEDDDDSCGDDADDESTANEEELDSECKEEKEHKRKRRKSVEDEIEKVVSSSPNGRFLKFDWEIGCGSFKTVYKGLDSETGVHVAWCELQVCN